MEGVWKADRRAVWNAAADVTEALSASRCAGELGQEIMAVLDRLVECDFGSILSALPRQEWLLNGQKGDNEVIRKNHWRYISELEPTELQKLSTTFSRARDAISPVRRQRLSLYLDFLAPNRQSNFIVRYWFMDGRVWSIGMSREAVGFSEPEARRLDAIFPQVKAILRAGTWLRECGDRGPNVGTDVDWSLTPAEHAVAALVMRGLTNKEAAALLRLSPNTVRNTVSKIFDKLGASRRSEIGFVLRGRGVETGSSCDDRRAHKSQLHVVHAIQTAQDPPSLATPLAERTPVDSTNVPSTNGGTCAS